MQANGSTRRRTFLFGVAIPFAALGVFNGFVAAQQISPQPMPNSRYQKPPAAIQAVLDAPDTPQASVSPAQDTVLLVTRSRYPAIAHLAQPVLRLAGLRINPFNFSTHNAPRHTQFVLKRVADGKETKVPLPPNPYLSLPVWSPSGEQFAFTNTTANSVELWVAIAPTGASRKIPGVALNSTLGTPCDWMPDSKTLLCRTVPAGPRTPPTKSPVPTGPTVQESFGRPAPVRTYQDLLQSAHDEDLFDFYANSQLALINTTTGKVVRLGGPAILPIVEPSPDGRHILLARVHRPYSYLSPLNVFPREIEVWDLTGRVVHRIASLPLSEGVPIGGVPTGPRNVQWVPTEASTLIWVEALDDGNPRKKVPHRDRVIRLPAPFSAQPSEWTRTEHRFAGLTFGETGRFAILREFDRDRLRGRTWFLEPANPSAVRLVWDLSTQDRYRNPGTPVTRVLPSGQSAIRQNGNFIFLTGFGASPEGDRPFLDRMDITTLQTDRLFRSDERSYETVVALLSTNGSMFLTRRESPVDPPNYFLRTSGGRVQAFTQFSNPTPQLHGIQSQLVTYKRPDGVQLSFQLYLPPDYKSGERRPAVLWAYPREFADVDVAGQVAGSPNRFTAITGYSHLFFLLQGYVVLDNASMPVVGDPVTVNNTYVEQIVASAKAAIDKADELGVIDRNRVGVGGHSYGAFMTANLLAHSDLFRAGIARSGAYNRTLTPFGFQSERRTLWEAPELYMKVSPFLFANKLQEPILLIHGEMDNNSGTFPIQSERMFQALKGNGGSVRYVVLPYESHGYSARESTEHVLWEMTAWFDQHVKNASASQARSADSFADMSWH